LLRVKQADENSLKGSTVGGFSLALARKKRASVMSHANAPLPFAGPKSSLEEWIKAEHLHLPV
jgi:hypothetical protein